MPGTDPNGGRPGNSLCVLVVDDYPGLADALAELLRRWGYRVQVARDGPTALEALRAQEPDVILVDIRSPGLDGYAVAELLCEAMTKRPRLVALTACEKEADSRRWQAEGFDGFFLKPADPDRLRQTLTGFASQADRLQETGAHDPASMD
jgi:CheY-like chemotaxis protein